MIKTLRITSVLAAMLAIACVAISVVYGTEDDPEVGALLKAPGAVEQFEKNKGKNARNGSDNTQPPLVVAAEELAKLINPPQQRTVRRPPAGTKITRRPTPAVAPKKVSAKFKVIGTCYSDVPANRCAFIDEPGQGQHWVRESDKIGHLTIQEIKDGLIVVHNGQSLEEIAVEETEVVSLIDDGKGPADGRIRATTQVSTPSPDEASTLPEPPVRRPGQSEASYQAALRIYRAKQAQNAAIKAVPAATDQPEPGQEGQEEGVSEPEIPRRPLTTDQDVKEFEDIVNTLRNLKDDPTAVDKTPEQVEADKRMREDLIKRMTAHMRRGNLRGNEPPSLGNRGEQLGGMRSGGEND